MGCCQLHHAWEWEERVLLFDQFIKSIHKDKEAALEAELLPLLKETECQGKVSVGSKPR